MYLSFYGLKENPFQISTNPRFLWLGEKHQEALASLRYGILGNKGFLLLTGGVGTGKTTLINALLASLEKDVVAATIPDPGLEQLDLYYFIAASFKIPSNFSSKGQFLIIFSQFLHEMHAKGKKVLLIIDEAQRLSPSMLEEIRLLSNIEKPDTKLINIFFVGQREFNSILLRQENRALRQRITVNYHIPPLSHAETAAYIEHRLKVAGASRPLFSNEAVRQIYQFSRGYPRLINVIADRSLLSGFVSEEPEVGARIVQECAQELKIPQPRLVVRKPKPEKVRQLARQVKNEEPEEQEEEETENQAVVAEPDNQPSAPENKSKQKPRPPSAAVKEERSAANVVTARRSVLPKALFLLLVLLVIAAGVCFWFYSAKFQKAVEDIQKKVAAVTEKQQLPPFPVPEGNQVSVAGSVTKEGASAQSTPSGSANIRSEGILPSEDKGKGRRSFSSGDDTAERGSAPVGGEKASADVSAKIILDEETSTAANESPKTLSGEGAEAGADGMATETGSLSAASAGSIFSQPLITGFDSDSSNLSPEGISMLNHLAKQVQRLPGSKIIIRGYSDSSGSASYNEHLSLFRANIVKSYLVAKGVKLDTMETIGMGAKNPIASNDTIEGRRRNRRVEIEVRP